MYLKRLMYIFVFLLSLVALSGCNTGQVSPTPVAKPSPTIFQTLTAKNTLPATFTDPFAYCTALINVDSIDSRYNGVKSPEVVVKALMKASQLPENAPYEPFAERTVWRCMKSKVYACNQGANIPCNEKANTERTPTSAIIDFCKTNPNSDYIPAAVSGRATIYQWRCNNGTPAIVKEITQPDERGFLSLFWYEITGK